MNIIFGTRSQIQLCTHVYNGWMLADHKSIDERVDFDR